MRLVSNSNSQPKVVAVDRKMTPIRVELPINPVYKTDCAANIVTNNFKTRVSNQQTVAWEHFLQNQLPNDQELNFVRDIYSDFMNNSNIQTFQDKILSQYLKSAKQASDQVQYIVQQLMATEMYQAERVSRGRQIVKKRLNETIARQRGLADEKALKWKIELRRLYHQMREAVQHILNAEGEAKFQRLNEMLEKKKHLDIDFLKNYPRRTTQQLRDLLGEMRILLSKKTDEMLVLKEVYGDDFAYDAGTVREISQSARSGEDSISILSGKLSASKSQKQKNKQKEEEKVIEKFYDTKNLKEKWKMDDTQLRCAIRRVIVKQTLSDAEHIKAKDERMQKIKTGEWGKPISYPTPQRTKTKRQVMLEQASFERRTRKHKERINFSMIDYRKEQEDKRRASVAENFFQNYNIVNNQGERFDSACRYAKLFV